ncbi:MAG: hypothetical protein H0W29_19290 [Gemmatimonadales bacterium]|nr:hypothetical protein [Gemmatimonadales bacterium]
MLDLDARGLPATVGGGAGRTTGAVRADPRIVRKPSLAPVLLRSPRVGGGARDERLRLLPPAEAAIDGVLRRPLRGLPAGLGLFRALDAVHGAFVPGLRAIVLPLVFGAVLGVLLVGLLWLRRRLGAIVFRVVRVIGYGVSFHGGGSLRVLAWRHGRSRGVLSLRRRGGRRAFLLW